MAEHWTCKNCNGNNIGDGSRCFACGRDRDAETTATIRAEYERGQEAKFQADAEAYLRYKGFLPRSQKYLDTGGPPAGWYVHVRQCEGNPYLLDLLVLPHNAAAFELELKADGGRLRKVQRQILDQHPRARLCKSMDDVRQAVGEYLMETQ